MKHDQKMCVLTIDDDLEILESINGILELEGYGTLGANNGKEGLELLISLEDFELPDLILLDLTMPALSGEAFLRELSKDIRFQRIPVVLMTAQTNLRQIMDHLKVEAYISKPMDMEKILQVAKNYTGRWEAAKFSFLA